MTHSERPPVYETPEQRIFYGLVGPDGLPVAEKILQILKERPHIARILIIGFPGAGKTTLSEGLRQVLVKMGYTNLQIFFDGPRNFLLGQYQVKSRLQLDNKTRSVYSRRLNTLLGKLPKRKEGTKIITTVEVPAVGDEARDLGHSFAKKVGRSPKNDTIIIHVFANEAVYLIAKAARNAAKLAKSDGQLKEMLQKIGLYDGEIDPDEYTIRPENRVLINHYLIMGDEDMIELIKKEYRVLRDAAYGKLEKKYHNLIEKFPEEKVFNLVAAAENAIIIPDHVKLELTTKERREMQKDILYAFIRFNQIYHFPPQLQVIAINQFIEDVLDLLQKDEKA